MQLGLSRSFTQGRHFPFFAPDGADGGSIVIPDTDDDLEQLEGVGATGKDAIKKERAAARAALKAKKESDRELLQLKNEKAQREADEKTRLDAEAAQAGEFEKLAVEREADLKTARSEIKDLKDTLERMETVIKGIVDADWKALPKEVADVFTGDEEDVLGKLEWLPKGKALAARIEGAPAIPEIIGNRPSPRSNGADTIPSPASVLAEMKQIRGR